MAHDLLTAKKPLLKEGWMWLVFLGGIITADGLKKKSKATTALGLGATAAGFIGLSKKGRL